MKVVIDGWDQILHQWDTGQRLLLHGAEPGTRVDFARCGEERAVSVYVYEEDGKVYCDIPDALLMEHNHIRGYVYEVDGARGETVHSFLLPVIPRPKPEDYVEPDDVPMWHKLEGRIIELEKDKIAVDRASVGQTIVVEEIDAEGKPTKWTAMDFPINGLTKETDPTVHDWAKKELFRKADLTGSIDSEPFKTIDGVEYYRYHAGSSYGFTWNNPDPKPGAVTITARGVSQYGGTGGTRLKTIYDDGTYGPDLYIVVSGESRTVTATTDANKTLSKITGNYDLENWVLLDMSVMSIQAEYNRGLPVADANAAGGVLADPATEEDTQPVRIKDGKLWTAPGGGGSSDAVQYVEQALTEDQQMQARKNLGLYCKRTEALKTEVFRHLYVGWWESDGTLSQIKDGTDYLISTPTGDYACKGYVYVNSLAGVGYGYIGDTKLIPDGKLCGFNVETDSSVDCGFAVYQELGVSDETIKVAVDSSVSAGMGNSYVVYETGKMVEVVETIPDEYLPPVTLKDEYGNRYTLTVNSADGSLSVTPV